MKEVMQISVFIDDYTCIARWESNGTTIEVCLSSQIFLYPDKKRSIVFHLSDLEAAQTGFQKNLVGLSEMFLEENISRFSSYFGALITACLKEGKVDPLVNELSLAIAVPYRNHREKENCLHALEEVMTVLQIKKYIFEDAHALAVRFNVVEGAKFVCLCAWRNGYSVKRNEGQTDFYKAGFNTQYANFEIDEEFNHRKELIYYAKNKDNFYRKVTYPSVSEPKITENLDLTKTYIVIIGTLGLVQNISDMLESRIEDLGVKKSDCILISKDGVNSVSGKISSVLRCLKLLMNNNEEQFRIPSLSQISLSQPSSIGENKKDMSEKAEPKFQSASIFLDQGNLCDLNYYPDSESDYVCVHLKLDSSRFNERQDTWLEASIEKDGSILLHGWFQDCTSEKVKEHMAFIDVKDNNKNDNAKIIRQSTGSNYILYVNDVHRTHCENIRALWKLAKKGVYTFGESF